MLRVRKGRHDHLATGKVIDAAAADGPQTMLRRQQRLRRLRPEIGRGGNQQRRMQHAGRSIKQGNRMSPVRKIRATLAALYSTRAGDGVMAARSTGA